MNDRSRRLDRAFQAIDAANAADPTMVPDDSGPVPKALLYGRRMTRWLERFCPDATELLHVAVRAQHIERWRIPRASFGSGRLAYRAWREKCAEYHGQRLGEILEAVGGYSATEIARAVALTRKQDLRTDPEAQIVEDVACLVFFAHELAVFVAEHPELGPADQERIVRRTWAKMSPAARETVLTMDLPAELRTLLTALNPPTSSSSTEGRQ